MPEEEAGAAFGPGPGRFRPGPFARMVAVTAALVVALTLASGCAASSSPTVVRAPAGAVEGVQSGNARQFLGLRYAEAPVGPLRWAPPVPAPHWDGTLPATAPGPMCPQAAPRSEAPQSEDCLFLNVTTPSDLRPGERLPVLVWWHGGGFITGSGADYGAQRLATQGRVAVVTVNYRLGALGYLGLPGLPESGAFGFADQIQSLRWTRDNITAFGGDPDNITVAGESAGGAATCALLTSPMLSAVAVRRVIVMSGACSIRWPANGLTLGAPPRTLYTPTAAAQTEGLAAATALGCPPSDPLGCLRSRPVDALLARNARFSALAYGNDLLPTDPAVALATAAPLVPVLYGGTRDEARSFFVRTAQNRPAALSPASYGRLVQDAFGAGAGRVAQQYPVAAYGGSGGLAWSTVITDSSWACPTWRDQQSLAPRTPTFGYEVSRPDGPSDANGFPSGGASHASELRLLFDLPEGSPGAGETDLAGLVVQYWSSFARTGRPEAASGPAWPAVTPGGPVRVMDLNPTDAQLTDVSVAHRCGFWDSVR